MELAQDNQRAYFEQLGSSSWTTVHDSEFESKSHNFGIYCAVSDPSRRERCLADPAWDLTVTDGAPGFSQSWPDGIETTTYHSVSTLADGVEPLILVREFHGAYPSTLEIDQQFRLFHNLRHDADSGNYFKLSDDGTEALAVKVEDRRVSIRTPLLRQYTAARQMDLLLFIDSVVFSDSAPKTTLSESESYRTEYLTGVRYYSDNKSGPLREHFTRYLATKILPHGPIESCGMWPYEPEDSNYPDFVIGEDEDGRTISYTCDPEMLADYFGKNPDAPHYLTPVHFRKDVLQKYYAKPELYSVEDGYLRCAGLWGLRIDNDHEDRVVVFLGDIGRDLPSSDRDHWRGYMIAPDQGISETNYRRSFLAQFVDPAALDLQFRRLYSKANESWAKKFGWPLFREPKESDVYLLQQIRMPLNDSNAEFEEAIKLLAKLMSDAINEAELQKALGTKIENEKGISKLQRLLEDSNYPEIERDIAYLRRVQQLRSKVTAHLKGRDYQSVLQDNLGDRRGIEAIRWLLEDGVSMLRSLSTWVQETS